MQYEQDPRYYTRAMKNDHAAMVGGMQCEMEVDKGERCPKVDRLESDHMVPYSEGGTTTEDNHLLVCMVHHAVKHYISGDRDGAQAVVNRMTYDELQELHELGYV